MSILLKYPNIPGNEICDGNVHTIDPKKLEKFYIDDDLFYLLSYDDKTVNESDLITILRKDGLVFKKVPLRDYNGLTENLEQIKLEEVDLSILSNVNFIINEKVKDNFDALHNEKSKFVDRNYDLINKQKIQDRTVQLENILTLMEDIIRWSGREPLDVLQNTFNTLRCFDLSLLTDLEFKKFIEDLMYGLNLCIEKQDGNLILGPAKLKEVEAITVIYDVVNRYFSEKLLKETKKEEISTYQEVKGDRIDPPGGDGPHYLSPENNYLYKRLDAEFNPYHIETEERKSLDLNYYVALHPEWPKVNRFLVLEYDDDKHYEKTQNNERCVCFSPNFATYINELFREFINKSKPTLFNPLTFTLDLDNSCYYYKYNDSIKNAINYEFYIARCDSVEKFDSMVLPSDIEVPEDFKAREYYRKSFVSEVFKEAVEGNLTLSTPYKTFPAKTNESSFHI